MKVIHPHPFAFVLCLCLLASLTAQAQTTTAWQYTALGDSLAYGLYDFEAGGYTHRYQTNAQADNPGVTITLTNTGVPGWTSDDLLVALRNDNNLRTQLANSQVITLDIGGNDLLNALSKFQNGACGGADNQDCLRSTVVNFKANWSAIIAQLLTLRSTSNTVIRSMDIYNPAVNQEKAFGVFTTLKPYLDDINRYIFDTSFSNHIACAQVYHAFNGINGDQDAGDRGLLAGDGIHPNSTGHTLIADQFRALAYYPLVTPQSTIQYALPVFIAMESEGRATVRVTRSGNTSGPASVEYSTVDAAADVRCDAPNSTGGIGSAYARCDYATTLDTLTFAPGETDKTFTIPLIDDRHTEGTEEFQIRLDNPNSGTLGARTTASVRIFDNDFGAPPNPIFETPFFVRMQYLDFLSREPEQGEPWSGVLNRCPDVNNTDPNSASAGCDRINVSASFFGSPEFQLKGYFVYKFYKVSYGRLPAYDEIIPDMRRVTGATESEVIARRFAFTNAWVERPQFRQAYPDSLSPAAFVDKLLQTAGVTLSGAVTRDSLINDLQTRTKTRAEIVRAIVEHPVTNAQEFNRAFVAMQYYGYLRRTPEDGGYNAWLNYLNTHPTDFRSMVNGFMNSQEYRLRFGAAQ